MFDAHPFVGLAAVAIGLWGAVAVPLFAVVAQTEATSIGWAEGGAVAMALGALAYIVRQLTNGSLVHRDLADSERVAAKLAELLEESQRREDRYLELLQDLARREAPR